MALKTFYFEGADWDNPDPADGRYFEALAECFKLRCIESGYTYYPQHVSLPSISDGNRGIYCRNFFGHFDGFLRGLVTFYVQSYSVSSPVKRVSAIREPEEGEAQDHYYYDEGDGQWRAVTTLLECDGRLYICGNIYGSWTVPPWTCTVNKKKWTWREICAAAGVIEDDLKAVNYEHLRSDWVKRWLKTRKQILLKLKILNVTGDTFSFKRHVLSLETKTKTALSGTWQDGSSEMYLGSPPPEDKQRLCQKAYSIAAGSDEFVKGQLDALVSIDAEYNNELWGATCFPDTLVHAVDANGNAHCQNNETSVRRCEEWDWGTLSYSVGIYRRYNLTTQKMEYWNGSDWTVNYYDQLAWDDPIFDGVPHVETASQCSYCQQSSTGSKVADGYEYYWTRRRDTTTCLDCVDDAIPATSTPFRSALDVVNNSGSGSVHMYFCKQGVISFPENTESDVRCGEELEKYPGCPSWGFSMCDAWGYFKVAWYVSLYLDASVAQTTATYQLVGKRNNQLMDDMQIMESRADQFGYDYSQSFTMTSRKLNCPYETVLGNKNYPSEWFFTDGIGSYENTGSCGYGNGRFFSKGSFLLYCECSIIYYIIEMSTASATEKRVQYFDEE